ncbi:ribosomal protein S6--L-glutamate ligase [Ruminococcaceae bacterium YRB3002]|nr:ribosomal protein S6--L-glutamate ligase [Ruminococcaceae bacterium YRB3002]
MTGLLVVNSFYGGSKMADIVQYLTRSASRHGITLIDCGSAELMHNYGELMPLKGAYDFVLFWDKDVVLARMIEDVGIRVFNCARAIEECDNKALTYIKLRNAGVRMPETVVAPLTFEGVGYNDMDFLLDAGVKLGFPMVIKELYGSFGQQVYLAHDANEAGEIVAGLGHKGFLMQKFIESAAGRDVRVNVVGNKVVSAMMRINENDFRSNISGGGHAEKLEVTDEIADLAVRACDALRLDFAGVDVLLSDKGPMVCEVNSNLHFKSSIDCTGVDVSDHIMKYIGEMCG